MEGLKENALVKRLQYLFTKMIPSNETENCYRALTEIRIKFISKPQQMSIFMVEGGIPQIVIQLKKSTPKIVDVALSILGHCVLEQEPRVLFRKAGGLPVLAKVLISFQDTAILSRACRVIGSLAHDKRNSMKLLELSVSVHHSLGQIIHSSEHEETLCMAIRAIHKLADGKEHITILGRYFIFPKLCNLLVKSESVNVLKKLFTTLFHIFSYMKRFSETSSHYWIGSEGGGKIIARLVDLRLHTVSAISTQSAEFMNLLVQDPHVRPLLAHKDAFNALIPVVIEELESKTDGLTIYTKSLFRLCSENPHAFQVVGGIPLLLKLIKYSDPKSGTSSSKKLHSQHATIFSTLLAFKYNQTALVELVECGVIDILVAKLVTYTNFYRDDKVDFEPSDSCGILRSPVREDENSCDFKLDGSENKPLNTRSRLKRQYRTTSPSYKAVEMECDLLNRYREAASNSDALNIFGWNCNRNDSSVPSSPVSTSSSPNDSTWSDGELESDGWSDGSPDFVLPSASLYANTSNVSPSYSSSSSTSLGSPSALSLSPLQPPSFASLSDFDDSDEEGKTTCYSPTNFEDDFGSPTSSPSLPCKKRPRLSVERRKLCCDPDIKMLWLKLGQADSRDFYEKWPELPAPTEKDQVAEVAIYLLLKLSWLDDTPHKLASQSVTMAIIDYLVYTPTPAFRACRILFRLATEPHLFLALLESRLTVQVHLWLNCRVSVGCCPLHSSLHRVGEQILDQIALIVSQFGRGEMEKILTQNQRNSNVLSVALATPLVVRSRIELRRFMNDLKVMDIIGDLLRQGSSSSRYAIASLSSLGAFLNMDDLICPSTVLDDIINDEPCQLTGVEEDVFFQLAPNQLVGGVKSRLQVPFFEAMFRGGFQESNSEVVSLTRLSLQPQVFKVILHLVYGCGRQCGVIGRMDRLVTSSHSAANLLQSLDHFLLLEYIDGMNNLIGSQDWSSYPTSYISLLSAIGQFPFSDKLRNHLRFLPFSKSIDLTARVDIVESLLKTEAADQYIDDWKQMFHSRLNVAC